MFVCLFHIPTGILEGANLKPPPCTILAAPPGWNVEIDESRPLKRQCQHISGSAEVDSSSVAKNPPGTPGASINSTYRHLDNGNPVGQYGQWSGSPNTPNKGPITSTAQSFGATVQIGSPGDLPSLPPQVLEQTVERQRDLQRGIARPLDSGLVAFNLALFFPNKVRRMITRDNDRAAVNVCTIPGSSNVFLVIQILPRYVACIMKDLFDVDILIDDHEKRFLVLDNGTEIGWSDSMTFRFASDLRTSKLFGEKITNAYRSGARYQMDESNGETLLGCLEARIGASAASPADLRLMIEPRSLGLSVVVNPSQPVP
ncbi:hypothetical protein SCAR479_10539 [Seiridium cardinale]|uniref:Uncharacterized protein n=1 Tax=Seiridium cardinale TaxID=138064 RepID=A0ABR2XGN7_9PEZI